MKYLLVYAAVLFLNLPGLVYAESYSAKDAAGNVVRLYEDQCQGPAWLKLRKATFLYQGKNYEACWLAVGDTIVVFDSNGDVTPLPKRVFKQDVSV